MKDKRLLNIDESILTGVEDIDRQHQDLLNLANDVGEALRKNLSSIDIRSIVRELLGYSIYHFNTEEVLMQQYAESEQEKTEANEHIAQHRFFSQRILSLQEKLLKREYVDAQELLVFLSGWVDDHMQNTDKALARLIRVKQEQ